MAIDLFKTQLCRHGPSHPLSGCRFAHSLEEVRRPDPRDEITWGRVHYYIGQKWDARTLRLFKHHCCALPLLYIPPWAWVAIWFHFAYPVTWEPGLRMDSILYEQARCYHGTGLILDSTLFYKMQLRRVALDNIRMGEHLTGRLPVIETHPLPRTVSRANSFSSCSSSSWDSAMCAEASIAESCSLWYSLDMPPMPSTSRRQG